MASDFTKAKKFICDKLEESHSKRMALLIDHYIGNNPERVKALVEIICQDDGILHQRGSYNIWVMRKGKANLLIPHLDQLLDKLEGPSHDAFGRGLLGTIANMTIPEEAMGRIADYCISALENPKEAIAIRANSMSVLTNICRQEPELVPEMELLISSFMEHGTAGYQARGRRVLKELNRIRKKHSL
ncbi:MAG: hypothetical protein HKN16_08745 [Saprospiraceae bacterium]|nr:hypothetical protein [Saprospiraceae bacterium]